ncbi:MAG: twin-arginine translocase subunit TatC [Actinomycetota bacterium]|nr:twin-arginine translocase subunit TatC [Actinomycetota bacterium]
MSRTDRSTAMPLTEHLRELRSRTVKSAIAVTIGMVIGWFFYPQLFAWISAPFNDAVAEAKAQGREITLALTGVADPFVLQLQVAAVAGLIISAPVWLYQLWRFITPGLHRHERRWALAFVAVAFPLVLAGVLVAYAVLPIGLDILFGFTPDGVANIVSVDRYLSFFLRMILVFCVGFLSPLVLIAMNLAGILTGKRLVSWWRWVIFIIFIFAAVATPTGDPINMSLLAAPILMLVTFAIFFCLLNDRRRARKRARNGDFPNLDDDEISPLNLDEDE